MGTIVIGRVLDASTDSVSTKELNQLVPAEYDYVEVTSYSDTNPLVIEYKTGGSGGTLVATLTMTYDGDGNLLTATRS